MTKQGLFGSTILVAGLVLCASTPAWSQAASPAPEDPVGIAEVVVTAQKRSERLQDVPISISAYGGEALQERAITDVAAVSNITPNVTLDAGTPFSGSTAALGAFVRGIGQNDFAINLDPGVGIYLDGVYLARAVGANVDLPDVERVEILKGPQGTLFGRNTVGGAISVVTRTPGDELAFRGSVTTGSYNRMDANGSVDLPLSDDLAALVTFSVKTRDGYAKRSPYPSTTPFVSEPLGFREVDFETAGREGGEDQRSLRGKLMWTPSERLKLTLSGDYTRVNQSAIPNAVFAVTAGAGPFAGLAQNNIPGTALDVVTGTSGFNFAGLYNFCIGATPAQIAARNAQNLCGPRGTPLNPGSVLPSLAGVNVDADPTNDRLPFDNRWVTTDPDHIYSTGNSFSRMKSYGVASTVDYELSDTLALRSITGYRELRFAAGIDADSSPLQILEVSQSMRQKQFSEELQLLGTGFEEKLHYVLGAYYFKEDASALDYANVAQGLLQIEGPVDLSTKNYATFGQVDFRMSPLIGVTVGARYTHEKKQFEAGQTDYNGFNYKLFNCTTYGPPCQGILHFPVTGEPLRIYVDGEQHKSFSNFSPKLGVQLHPNDDTMVYGSWSRGYKTGGWTTRLQNPVGFAPDFDPERAETFEAGIKSVLLDRRLQVNLAAFTTRYSGIQLNFQQGASPTLQNAGTARIKGFELDLEARPTRAFTLNIAAGYTDAQYTSVEPQSAVAPSFYQAGVFDGAPLAKTPKWKINISPRYEFDLGEQGRLVLVVDYTYTSAIWNDTERTFLLRRPKTDTLAASVSYHHPSDAWDLTIGGTNLTEDRYPVNGLGQIAGGLIYGAYAPPRQWYAKLGVRF